MPLEAEFVQYLATLNSSEAEFNSLPLVERSTIRRNFSQAHPGIGNDDVLVSRIVTAMVALMNPIPPTQPTSVIPTPGHGSAMNAHIPELPPADVDPWETYAVTRTPLEKDYYYKKLFPRFKAVNGDNRFRLSKHTAFIMIKDGSERIFKCDRNNASFQRNLYLEFHDCDYNCEAWMEQYLNNHSMEYKETDSPPLHFVV